MIRDLKDQARFAKLATQYLTRTVNMLANAMNEWDFIGQGIFVGIRKSATIYKFKQKCGYVRDGRLVVSNSPLIIAVRYVHA